MRSYYDILDVAPTASADEIKRAFRREIAKYHPDKVEHLGREFHEIAAVKTGELTQAYKTLTEASLRADYDAQLKSGAAAPPERPGAASPPQAQDVPSGPGTTRRSAGKGTPPPDPEPVAGRRPGFSQDRAGASDLVRKAAVMRFRQATSEEFGDSDEAPVQGFDVICAPPKKGFFSRSVLPRILGRFVPRVDAASVQESWTMASRITRDDQRDLCVFVMGPVVAQAEELGRVIAAQRRKPIPGGGTLVLVPVNTRTWAAYIPSDAPPAAKALLARLRSG